MGLYDDLNRGGLLAIGLIPEWVNQSSYDGAPSTASSGVYLQESPKALVHVAARESVHTREARVVIDTFDLTTTVYTVTIDSNPVAYDASSELPADNNALVQGIVDGINADGTVGPLVTASVDPDDETGATILIVGDAEADYSFDATVSGGSGEITATAAAVGFDVRLFVTPGGIIKSGQVGAPGRWVLASGGEYTSLDYRGFTERFDVAGLDRLYVELDNVAKHASDGATVTATIANVMVGPAVLEATS